MIADLIREGESPTRVVEIMRIDEGIPEGLIHQIVALELGIVKSDIAEIENDGRVPHVDPALRNLTLEDFFPREAA